MITLNGKIVSLKQGGKDAEQWAKEAADRIFSHYTKQELETLRKQNARIK